jgi:protein tyrosine/serine phosphatase
MEYCANFREIVMGAIAPNTLYRSEHPICDGKQVKEIILAADSAGIKTVINLCDNYYSLKSKIINCPWYKKIVSNDNAAALDIRVYADFFEKIFCGKIKKGLLFMIEREPPYLIHCEAGVDRTGFLSIILESLMDAEIGDIVKDYMRSFDAQRGYPQDDYKKGEPLIINLFSKIKGELINKNEKLRSLSEKYLLEKIGLNANEITILTDKLAG